jgi:hypothetical protein
VSADGTKLGERSEDYFDLFTPMSRVAESETGQTFVGWSWRFNDRQDLDLYARRYDATLTNTVWPQIVEDQAEVLVGAEFVAGSIVYATSSQLFRTDSAGSYALRLVPLEYIVTDTESQGDEVFLLGRPSQGSTSHSVHRVSFAPAGAAGTGDFCGLLGCRLSERQVLRVWQPGRGGVQRDVSVPRWSHLRICERLQRWLLDGWRHRCLRNSVHCEHRLSYKPLLR